MNRKHSMVKALTWRVIATLITAIVAFLITGRFEVAVSIGALDAVIKIIAFYYHERFWNGVKWGRVING